MGALNSTLTPEQVIGGGAVAAGIAVSAYYIATKPGEAPAASQKHDTKASTSTGGKKRRKGKAASGVGEQDDDDGTPAPLAASATLFNPPAPNASEDLTASTSSAKARHNRKRGTKKGKPATSEQEVDEDEKTPEPSAGPSTRTRKMASSKYGNLTDSQLSTGPAMDASWTEVQTRGRRKHPQEEPSTSAAASVEASSDAGLTGEDSQSTNDRDEVAQESSLQSLANKIGHKAPKTVVDDMLPPEPPLARVLRVTSPQDSDDMMHSTDADAEEEGWGIVRRRRPAAATAVPEPPAELSKDQRRREARKEQAKAANEDAEADRLERLARHKREQEKARMEEQAARNAKKSRAPKP